MLEKSDITIYTSNSNNPDLAHDVNKDSNTPDLNIITIELVGNANPVSVRCNATSGKSLSMI